MIPITDEQIEAVARAYCVAMGLDPEQSALPAWFAGRGDLTPMQRRLADSRIDPAVADGPHTVTYAGPLWRLYQGKALSALAMQQALASIKETKG